MSIHYLVKSWCSKIALISTLTPVAACPSWAYEQDYQFPRRLKRFGYIRCNTTVSVLIDFSGCGLFRMLCLPKQRICSFLATLRYINALNNNNNNKQSVHHRLPPLWKCNNLKDRGHFYQLPDLWLPNSPDLNPTDHKIWGIIQQQIQI